MASNRKNTYSSFTPANPRRSSRKYVSGTNVSATGSSTGNTVRKSGRTQTDLNPNSTNSLLFHVAVTGNVNSTRITRSTKEGIQRNPNNMIQNVQRQSPSTSNYTVSAYSSTSYSDSPSISYVSSASSSSRLVSSVQKNIPSTRNSNDLATHTSASSKTAAATSNTVANQGIENEGVITENENATSLDNEEASSVGPECPICLENYEKVMKIGSHFIAIGCGHVFCINCANDFMDSRKCPKCRSSIDVGKTLRLHF